MFLPMRWSSMLLLCGLTLLPLLPGKAVTGTLAPLYAEATIEPVSTSIYIGRVTLTCPPLTREGQHYRSTYTAKVFPFFFQSERGELAIELTDEDLARLANGERVNFTGEAVNTGGDLRRIEGHADPLDATSGEIKVRIFVTRRIQLIFNTTYRFSGGSVPES